MSTNTPDTQTTSFGSAAVAQTKSAIGALKKTGRRFRHGFTIIELVGVLAVLGLLASVAIAGYRNLVDSAGERAVAANVANINDAIARARDGGATTGTYNLGSTVVNGSFRVDSVANIVTDLRAGVWTSGVLFQLTLPGGNFTPASYELGTPQFGAPRIQAVAGANQP